MAGFVGPTLNDSGGAIEIEKYDFKTAKVLWDYQISPWSLVAWSAPIAPYVFFTLLIDLGQESTQSRTPTVPLYPQSSRDESLANYGYSCTPSLAIYVYIYIK